MSPRTSSFAHLALRTENTEAGHHSLTGPPCVRLWAAASVAGKQTWFTATSILTRVGCAVTRRDTFVGIPLVDTQKIAPAGVASTDVGSPTADLH